MRVFALASIAAMAGTLLTGLLFSLGSRQITGSSASLQEFDTLVAWTLPFSLLVGALAFPISIISKSVGRTWSTVIRIALGVAGAFVWTVVFLLFLGPFSGAMSIPVLPMWLVGGISGTIWALETSDKRGGGLSSVQIAIPVLLAAVVSALLVAIQLLMSVIF